MQQLILKTYELFTENKNMEDFSIKNLFNDKEWSMLDVNKQNEYDYNDHTRFY